MTVVAPAEADLTVLHGEEAVVGDGDAVGVAAEVVEDLVGAGEGALGVDDPLGLAEGLEVACEGVGVVERGQGVAELEPAGVVGLLEQFEEEAAEQAGEKAVRVYREHRGMTQNQLASSVGINALYLSQIERGRRTGSARTLSALAEALGVDVDDVI